MESRISRNFILNMRVDVTSNSQATQKILEWHNSLVGRYVCVANVHMCMEAYDDSDFLRIVNGADMTIPDGRPLIWALKALGANDVSQVRGSDLLLYLCKGAEKENIPIGFYGGTQNSLNGLLQYLKDKFPKLNISFFSSPPFRELTKEEEGKYVDEINASGARILFVGIGCPKQEKWMAKHKTKLPCVMVGVGAAFDFLSGEKKKAPRWMQKIGFEWLFRLGCEPRRLWKRYLRQNPRFVWHFFRQLVNR